MPPEVAEAMRADLEARYERVEVWPENWPAVEFFCAVGTQWRVSLGGAVGLDYAAVEAAMRMLRIKPAARPDLFERLRVMEAVVLAQMRA